MTTRSLLLPALCIAAGCYAPTEPPNADDEPVTEEKSSLPVAPAPRAQKTTAELLIGTWRMVKDRDTTLPADIEILLTFTPDGKFVLSSKDQKNKPRKKTGTYRLRGTLIRFDSKADSESPGEGGEAFIEAISEQGLTTVNVSTPDRERAQFKRVETR